jgi:hypothetical protein
LNARPVAPARGRQAGLHASRSGPACNPDCNPDAPGYAGVRKEPAAGRAQSHGCGPSVDMVSKHLRQVRWHLLAALGALCPLAASGEDLPPPRVVEAGGGRAHFDAEVAALIGRCLGCHRGEGAKKGLVLTSREAAIRGGDSGPALVPGAPARSLLYRMLAEKKMPPRKPFSSSELEAVRRWIAAGAPWEGELDPPSEPRETASAGRDGWSLEPLCRPPLPIVGEPSWAANPIDLFILERLEAHGLAPSPPALAETLLRRLSFDLTGLPPAPGEIEGFLGDPSPAAYEAAVERLLASPRYGERWGRHWLDAARFGESDGFEYDRLRPNAWRYRDYVIASFNADKPYPLFVAEQIAGDVLEPAAADGIIATAFLVCGPWDEAGNLQKSEVMKALAREEELEDTVAAVTQTFLGMTANCARCHDHKFDPIPQRDYYAIKAAFEGIGRGDRPALAPEALEAQRRRLAELEGAIAELERRIAAVERAGREEALELRRGHSGPPRIAERELPEPIARWTFEEDARDLAGEMHGELLGGASVAGGRLRLDGKGAYLRSRPLARELGAKTLEAWVALSGLAQRGGGAIGIEREDRQVFDSIVFGERQPRKWIAGSELFRRTRDLEAPEESAGAGELVHLAAVYAAGGAIQLYRGGKPYGHAYRPEGAELAAYAAGASRVLIGLRHTGAGNGFLAGEIEEACLYDRPLSAEEVEASHAAGPETVSREELIEALGPERRTELEAALEELSRLRRGLEALPPVPLAYAAVAREPGPTFVFPRGDVEQKGEQVAAGALSCVEMLPPLALGFDAPEGLRRRRLAAWIASPENPLTARVLANRIWHHHFGRGLVGTPNDFGSNGEPPSHPELLDWLASELIAQGWSVKSLQRAIVLSSAYRQSSAFHARAAALDAENRLLWRFSPRRLEAEAVRDAVLFTSGELNLAMGGPSLRPFTIEVFGSNLYTPTDPPEPEFQRRTVYRMNVQSARSPLLDAFDCPDPSVKTPRREVTTTPLQALSLMNGSFVLRQACRLAERLAKDAGSDAEAQVELAFRLAFARRPAAWEAAEAVALAREHGLEKLCWVLFNAGEFVHVR